MFNLNATFYINTYLLIKQERFPNLIPCIYDHIFDRIFSFNDSKYHFTFGQFYYSQKVVIKKNTHILMIQVFYYYLKVFRLF